MRGWAQKTRLGTRCRRLWTLALLGCWLAALPAVATRTESLPAPALEGADPAIRELVESLRRRVEGLAGAGETRELAEAYGDLGRAAFFFHDRELAAASLRNATELDPNNFRWWYFLGALYQEQRELAAAAEALTRAAQLAPSDVPSRLRLAQVRLLEGQLEAAETLYEEIAARDAGDGAEHYGLGRIAAERGDHATAIEHFRRALELQPEAAEVHQQIGLSYRALGDLDAARRHLGHRSERELRFADPLIRGLDRQFQTSSIFRGMVAEREGRFDEAIAEYRKAVEASPANVAFRRALAGALVLAGRLDEGVAEYREAVEIAPEEALSRVRLAKALQARDGRSDEALAELRSAVDLAPDLVEARIALAGSLASRGHWDEAEGHLDRVLEIEPDERQVRLRRAQMRIALGRGEDALEDLETVLEAEPGNLEARLGRGQALSLLGRHEAAEAELEAVLAEEQSTSKQAIAWMELGAVSVKRGDLEAAAERYGHALDLAPEHLPAQLAMARVLADLGRTQEALATLDLALMVGGEVPEARLLRAELLAAQGQAQEAIDELEALRAAHPEHLQAALDLAALQARTGDLATAVETLGAALEIAPDAASRSLTAFQAGVLEQQRGRVEEAIRLYGLALEGAPEMRDALFNLGVALASQGKMAEARARFEQLVSLDPADVAASLALARSQTSVGDFLGARQTLARARQRSPSHPALMRAQVEILVGSPDPAARDPRAAVPLARQLVSGRPSVENLALLAAALAASGDFQAAASVQERAVEQARATDLAADQRRLLERDLERYRQGPPTGSEAGG